MRAASLHTVQLLGGQLHFPRLLVPAGCSGCRGGGGGCSPSGPSCRRSNCGGRYWDGDLGLGGHRGLVDVPGSEVEVWDGLHQLSLGLFQQAIDVLGAELGQAGTLLLPVPLCRLTYIQI